jgi:hypothetical protein
MYRRTYSNQLSLLEDNMDFHVKLNPGNRWVKAAAIMPWDKIEEHYASNMCEDNGREGITARIAFGSIYAKEQLGVTDIGIVENIIENVYLQYFLGLWNYSSEQLFDSSMMVHFRKRFTPEFVKQVNDFICTGEWFDDDDINNFEPPKPDENGDFDSSSNSGNLSLDCTVSPADIRYPNDIALLNECRENVEKFIHEIWDYSLYQGKKTPYSRIKAHRNFTKYISTKRRSQKFIESTIHAQLDYLCLAINQLVMLLGLCGEYCNPLSSRQQERFDLICEIYDQQKYMFENNTRSFGGDKILSLRQPFVRSILRNKAKAKYEYGQKLALSKANGWVFVDKQSWNNFNECHTLEQSVYDYYRRFGHYPEAVLADKIYHTKANKAFCKSLGIRLGGSGKYRKNADDIEKKQAYNDQCQRNEIEGVNGVLKRKYGLDLIMCYDPHNAEVEAYLQVLCMNVQSCILAVLFRLLGLFGAKRVVLQ